MSFFAGITMKEADAATTKCVQFVSKDGRLKHRHTVWGNN